jgi:ABC-type spermidine/putrescine transport system permease subunit II
MILAGARSIAGYILVASLATLTVGPIAFLLQQSLTGPGLSGYLDVASSGGVRRVFLYTIELACCTTAICMLVAIPAARVLHDLPHRWRSFFMWLIIIPSFTSFLVRTYAWVALLSRTGPLRFIDSLFGWSESSLVGTFSGVVVASVHMLLPVSILTVYVALDAALQQQQRAAAVLGTPPSLQFTGIFLPNVMTSVASGAALVFIVSSGLFIVPALIGGGRQTTVAQLIYIFATDLLDLRKSAIIALLLTALIAIPAATMLNSRLGKGSARRRNKGASLAFAWALSRLIAPVADGRAGRVGGKAAAYAIFAAAILCIVAPLIYVVLVSFQPLPVLALPSGQLSLRWYIEVFNDPTWIEAAETSLRIALVVAIISVIVGYSAAAAVHRRTHVLMNRSLTVLCVLPLTVPGMALALGLYGIYMRVGLLGTQTGVIVAHTIVALTFSFLYILAGLSRYDERLDVAARVLGAGSLRTLLQVRLPLLLPALAAAFLLSFLTSFDEFLLTLFVAGVDVRTLPLRMWASATQDIGPELAVPGTIILLISIGVAIICSRVGDGPRFKGGSA